MVVREENVAAGSGWPPHGILGSGAFDATTRVCLEAGVHERCWEPGCREVLRLVAAFRTPSGLDKARLEGHQTP